MKQEKELARDLKTIRDYMADGKAKAIELYYDNYSGELSVKLTVTGRNGGSSTARFYVGKERNVDFNEYVASVIGGWERLGGKQ